MLTCSVVKLTPAGRGAVAVISVTGPASRVQSALAEFFQPANPTPLADRPMDHLIYGRWGTSSSEDVVVCRTSLQSYEIQCHGGEAAVSRLIEDLKSVGIRHETRSSGLPGKTTLFKSEYEGALTQALTWRTADLINEQAQGVFHRAVQALMCINWTDLDRRQAEVHITNMLSWSRFGTHLSQPWRVGLIGLPNVGKSSLMNGLLGFRRSIVTEMAGTTRDVVTSITAFDGWPILLADTAGLRQTHDALESEGILRGQASTAAADLQLMLIDRSQHPDPETRDLLQSHPEGLLVAHKCDLDDAWGSQLPAQALPVSSVTGQGLEELTTQIVRRLIPQVPEPATPFPISQRQVVKLSSALRALQAQQHEQYRAELDRLIHEELPT